MVISVASGKGGTGKTLVSTSMALCIDGAAVQLLDCDVEEPNAHLLLRPQMDNSQPVEIMVPCVDESRCTYCRKCSEVCVYHAIAVIQDKVLLFPELCHGCGACSYLCPEKCITETGRQVGVIESGYAGNIDFVHGRLNIGEAMAPPVIRSVKGKLNRNAVAIIDVPPGTSCPVVESIKDSNYCVLVTEPTPFGLYDLALAVEVVKQLHIPCGVIINRAGSNDEKVESYCAEANIPVLMKIPLDVEIARLYSRGIPLIDGMPQYKDSFSSMMQTIMQDQPQSE